jgi:hypothetical protein
VAADSVGKLASMGIRGVRSVGGMVAASFGRFLASTVGDDQGYGAATASGAKPVKLGDYGVPLPPSPEPETPGSKPARVRPMIVGDYGVLIPDDRPLTPEPGTRRARVRPMIVGDYGVLIPDDRPLTPEPEIEPELLPPPPPPAMREDPLAAAAAAAAASSDATPLFLAVHPEAYVRRW